MEQEGSNNPMIPFNVGSPNEEAREASGKEMPPVPLAPKRKAMAKRSEVWHHFTAFVAEDGTRKAILISTMSSESAFSTGGRVLDAFRSSLTPKIVQALICGQDWIRASVTRHEIKIEEDLEDLERLENELSQISVDHGLPEV
ncbi:hypothetical protein K2173_021360 [Erythroxylum novogranatense]|uniref:HAT C-terminal dimerisation domain-containing protein n=1 Tax=Erythroxylum novogranatense TaxID=1862640 RepID=A0AAV8TV65_9ROSI|nr:hypothetical protein K2173_021360 [Erythroxylum novogranatense]